MSPFDSPSLCRVLFDDIGLPSSAELAVAYSGGHDSHVLLHALSLARREYDFGLTALHFDHGLQPQSADWARQCAAVCEAWDIAFVSHREALVKPPGESLEALARRRRYRWFERAVAPRRVLLTAHHANDQAETVLLNLLRGGGLESLAGIPQQRILSAEKSTRVVRPLLSWRRDALAEYARHHALSWIEDPSNQSGEFDRNHIRQSVIPLLEQRWPAAVGSLGRGAEHCREAARFLDEVVRQHFQRCRADEKRGVFCLAPPLNASKLKPLGRFQTLHLIRHWAHRHGHRSPSTGQLATFYEQVFEAQSESAGVRWNGAELRYFNDHLYLTRQLDDPPTAALDWNLQTRDLGVNGLRIETHKETNADLNPAQLHGKPLQLKWRQGGERITLPGRAHSSELKKLLQQNAVPPWERRALPLLVVDGEIAWVHGIGASAACCCGEGESGISLKFVVGGDNFVILER